MRSLHARRAGPACATILFLVAPLLVGCTASPLAYPHFWDYTRAKPNDRDLVGTYKFLKSSGSFGYGHGYRGNRNISVTLLADHSAILSGMPQIESDKYQVLCSYSGPGVWQLDDYGDPDGGEWHVMIETKEHIDSRSKTWGACTAWSLLLSRHPPYRLYQVIGDPDNDTGLEFGRVQP